MSMWRQIGYGLRNLLLRAEHDRESRDEVEQYLRDAAEELRKDGLSAEEARRAVRMAEGDSAVLAARVGSYGWEGWVRNLARDVRIAGRQLRKHPSFTATAVLTLALGIGANAAIFTVVKSVLLAPLPYANANRLAAVQTHFMDTGRTSPRITGPDAVDVETQTRGVEAMSLYSGGKLGVQMRDHAVYTVVTAVDANFPRVFDLQPIAGRIFANATTDAGALVSEQFARDNFGSAEAAPGHVLHIENEAIPIAGVLPARFTFPDETQIWVAYNFEPASKSRTAFNYHAVARLRDGVSFPSVQAEFNALSQRLQIDHPGEDRGKQFRAEPLRQALTGDARPTLLLLWGTVGVILLIACVNVTHLQLVRSLERQREIAICKALGSSAFRILLPVAVESLLLSVLGGMAGVLLAAPALHVLLAMAPKTLPRSGEVHIDGWVLAFTLSLAVIAALASSLFPALRALRTDPADALKNDASRGMGRRGSGVLRDGLVVAQIASTFVLTVGAVLLLHTLNVLMTRDMGFQPQQMLVVDADVPAHSLADTRKAVQQFDAVFARLSVLPGVEHVAGIMGLPTGPYGSNGNYNVRGGLPVQPEHAPWANFSVASPGYFETMGIPLKRGRDFTAQDGYDAPFVTVISESVARQSFGDADPIGKQIQCGLDSDKWMTIIGVVGDVRQNSPAEQPGPALYMPMAQHPGYANQIDIVMRTRVKPLTPMAAAKAQIAGINPLVAMRFTTMDDLLDQSVAVQRFRAVLLSCFAGVGFLLAMLGVYGTIAYSVAQRTVEIGIRMAFGAERSAILQGVLRHAGRLASIGIGVGLVLSMVFSRVVANMLVGVSALDPLSLGAAALLLLIMAVAAAFAPGWRATRVDPMAALRAE